MQDAGILHRFVIRLPSHGALRPAQPHQLVVAEAEEDRQRIVLRMELLDQAAAAKDAVEHALVHIGMLPL